MPSPVEEAEQAKEQERRMIRKGKGKQAQLTEEEQMELALEQSKKAAQEDEERRARYEARRREVGDVNKRVMELQNKINAPVGSKSGPSAPRPSQK